MRQRIVVGVLYFVAVSSFSQIPSLMSFQGRLMDTNGMAVNGSVDIAVELYDDASFGSLLYAESVGATVVQNGIYHFEFGTNTTLLKTALLQAECWMEQIVDGTALLPRQRMIAVPYALHADMLDGFEASAFATGMPVYLEADPDFNSWLDTNSYIVQESDPVWSGVSNDYYLKSEADGLFVTGTPLYVESDPTWTMASNEYYLAVDIDARFATGTPVYIESDPLWVGASNAYYLKSEADVLFATGLPVYVESDPVWAGESNAIQTQLISLQNDKVSINEWILTNTSFQSQLNADDQEITALSNAWKSAESTTNSVRRTGDMISGNLGVNGVVTAQTVVVENAITIGSNAVPPVVGTIRWNPVTTNFEGYTGVEWISLGISTYEY